MSFIRSILKYILSNRISIRKYHKNFIMFKSKDHLNFFFAKKYEQNTKNNILPFIKKCNLIFDVGANIGQYTLFFKSYAKVNTKIICFEPDPEAFHFLKINIYLNDLTNIFPNNLFVSNLKNKMTLFLDNQTGSRMSSFKKNQNNSKKIIVKSISLTSAIKKYGVPDFLKIDVENYETLIFKNIKVNLFLNTYLLVEVTSLSKKNIYNYFKNSHFCYCAETFSLFKSFNQIPDKLINLFFIPISQKLFN